MKSFPINQTLENVALPSNRASASIAPWRPLWLLAAPHRLAFFFAALMMTMGFMPLYFAGFLFTAGPKWLNLPEVSARSLLPILGVMLGDWISVLIGFHTHTGVASAGVGFVAIGWTALSVKFFTMLRRSRVSDRVHASAVAIACVFGLIALWTAAVSMAFDSDLLLRTATQVGLWGFIATVFAVVSQRMIPFFSVTTCHVSNVARSQYNVHLACNFHMDCGHIGLGRSIWPLVWSPPSGWSSRLNTIFFHSDVNS